MTSTFSRIFDLKIDFLTFAWPKSCVGILRQIFGKIFSIPHQIPDLLILIWWVWEKVLNKNRSKNEFYKADIAKVNP